jgi:DNA modification methylase
MTVTILCGDCRDVLRELPAASVHCVVTSPPYWGLRDYGTVGQIGLEPVPDAYVATMVEVFREVRRVLRKDGTLWLNLGDSYAGGGGFCATAPSTATSKSGKYGTAGAAMKSVGFVVGLKAKDLCGIPWRVAFALQADGWYLRQDIIWSKPNPMPESVTDRCTKAHEYLFLMAKSERYYFDQEAISEPITQSTVERLSQPTLEQQEGSWRVPGKTNGPMKAVLPKRAARGKALTSPRQDGSPWNENGGRGFFPNADLTRNKRSVWEVTTQPFSEAHFATFPPALIEPCILAGCPKDGTVLDPFGGAGTTGLVADRLQRNAVLIELNPQYVAMTRRRIESDAPLFAVVAEPPQSSTKLQLSWT